MNYETSVKADVSGTSPAYVDYTADEPRSSRKWWIIGAIILIAFAALVAFFALGGAGQAPADDGEGQAPTISVISPGSATVEGTINATGTLAARRALPVGSVGEGGRVVSVPVDAGDWVRQGQVLAVIDRSVQVQQIASARANIDVAQADADLAQANLDRALQLVDRGFISKADVDRLTATRDSAVARVRVARAQVAELQARTARLNIYAPAAGLVLERNVEPGQTVGGAGGPLFLIARGGEMELMANVSEDQLAKLSTGVTAEVTPVGSDKTFAGQVWQIAPVINESDRQGTARISLPYARELRPGGFASARIRSGTLTAPVLPESAVLSDDKGSYVYIIDDENKARRRPIETGMVTAQGIVVSGGLDGSERIVLRAGGFLTEGESVNPQVEGASEG